MPDHRVNRTFTLVNFLLSRVAFTMVSHGVYTHKIFTWVSKLQYLGKTLKCKRSIRESKVTVNLLSMIPRKILKTQRTDETASYTLRLKKNLQVEMFKDLIFSKIIRRQILKDWSLPKADLSLFSDDQVTCDIPTKHTLVYQFSVYEMTPLLLEVN